MISINVSFTANTVKVSYGDRSLKAFFPEGMPASTKVITDVIRASSHNIADMLSEEGEERAFKRVLVEALYEKLIGGKV